MGPIDLDGFFKGLVLSGILAGVGMGFFLFVVLPWLWTFIKPWLHAVTG